MNFTHLNIFLILVFVISYSHPPFFMVYFYDAVISEYIASADRTTG